MRNQSKPVPEIGGTRKHVWSPVLRLPVIALVIVATAWTATAATAAETWDARVNDMVVWSGSGGNGLSTIASNCSDPLFYHWDQGSSVNCTHEYTVTAGAEFSITCDAVISHQGGTAVTAADVPAVVLSYRQSSPPGPAVNTDSKKGSQVYLQPAPAAPGPGQKFLWLDQPGVAILDLSALGAGDYHFSCTVNPGQTAFPETDLANNTMQFILHVKASVNLRHPMPTLIPRVPPIGPSPERGDRVHPPEPVRPTNLTPPRGWTRHDDLLLPAVQHASVHLADGRTLIWNGSSPGSRVGDYILRGRNGRLLERFADNARVQVLTDGELEVIQGAHGRPTIRLGHIAER